MQLVAGIDTSTQSVKVVIRDAQSGQIIREGRAAAPSGYPSSNAANAGAVIKVASKDVVATIVNTERRVIFITN